MSEAVHESPPDDAGQSVRYGVQPDDKAYSSYARSQTSGVQSDNRDQQWRIREREKRNQEVEALGSSASGKGSTHWRSDRVEVPPTERFTDLPERTLIIQIKNSL
jgi:hypothetical protein